MNTTESPTPAMYSVPSSADPMIRRKFLKLSGVGCLAAITKSHASIPTSTGFSFAFLTDIHVQPEKGAATGFSQCLAAVEALAPKPAFVITGGDHVMDSLLSSRERIQVQWRLFDECWKRVQFPSYHVIGNHDVGGWAAESPLTATDAEYGKQTFADRYGRGKTWRSFDHEGWHFILLDSIRHDPGTPRGFLGWIDDEQAEWLQKDLERTGRKQPIIVVSHIPFFSVVSQVQGDPRAGVNKQGLVNNAHVIRTLLARYNVKLLLSGHGHVLERIEIAGITYIQGGAVCGNWWRGPIFGYPEGFGVVTCRADGTFHFAYRDYGWKPVV